MKTISLKVPEALAARLIEAAAQAERSKSAVIREALEQFLSREGHASAGSFTARASDLAGCLSGPEDLSFDARHLEGYGP